MGVELCEVLAVEWVGVDEYVLEPDVQQSFKLACGVVGRST